MNSTLKGFFKCLTPFIILILAIIITFVIAYFIEPERLIINEQTISSPYWEKDLDGFKIVVVSDLHLGSRHVNLEKLQKIAKISNSQNPDLVVFLGDFDAKLISVSEISEQEIANELNKFQSKCGSISILGNHDFEPEKIVRNILSKTKITVLENQEKIIYYKNKPINIVGLKDWWHAKYNPDLYIENNTYPTIILSHNPDVFPQIKTKHAITLAGHTHGGEIRIPFFGAIFIPSNYGQKYGKGLVIQGDKQIFISSGIASLSRMRLFNPPEIVVLTMYKN